MKYHNYAIVFLLMMSHTLSSSIALLRRYETLQSQIPYTPLCELPTPLTHCTKVSQALGCTINAKRDDMAGKLQSDGTRLFGGNKPRKLAFLLADAKKRGCKAVLTRGCAGSNHALATAIYAKQLGLKTICLLADQPNSWVVRRNLELQAEYGAEIHHYKTTKERNASVSEHVRHCEEETGFKPYLIPPGGSTPCGVLGFIDAVLELQEQILAGVTVVPDYIYVPAGSLGTTVGLLIGLQLISCPTILIAVATEPEDDRLADTKRLFEETRAFLCELDKSFSSLAWRDTQLLIYENYYGEGYGHPTQAATDATQLFQMDGIVLEDTYTAKAASALIADAQSGLLAGKHILFWSTFYPEPCTSRITQDSHRKLPTSLQKEYFAHNSSQ